MINPTLWGRALFYSFLATTLTLMVCQSSAQSLSNPSFEANGFSAPPGYVSGNTAITGWTVNDPTRAGLNPASGSLFADNGAIPNGTNVAFVQSTGGITTLSNSINGLTSGLTYRVTFRANSRSSFGGPPNATWSLNNGAFVPFTASPAVGGTNAYYVNSGTFVATASSAPLVIANQTAGDSTVLVDDFRVNLIRVVTTTNDFGAGSLRAILAIAGGNDIITFTNTLAGKTIVMTNSFSISSATIDASSLSSPVTLTKNDYGTHPSGVGNRIFTVNSAGQLNITGLVLTNGRSDGDIILNGGGAIALGSGASLNASNCVFVGNHADDTSQRGGAILGVAASLVLSQCVFSNNTTIGMGGAIYNEVGNLTLNNCTFFTNTSQYGGGIATYKIGADAGVWTRSTGCTFYANNGGTQGGAVYSVNPSFTNNSCDASFVNCTFFKNVAPAGSVIYALAPAGTTTPRSTILFQHCTIVSNAAVSANAINIDGNGGVPDTIIITNSMVNSSPSTSQAHVTAALTNGNNLTGANTNLAPIGYYGGPTLTIPSLPGSPALNAAIPDGVTTDQRGYPRPAGTAPDLGAVEGLDMFAATTVLKSTTRQTNGSVSFAFTNLSNIAFSVLASTNLTAPVTSWTNLGRPTESPAGSGQFQFTDTQATNSSQRYYRVTIP